MDEFHFYADPDRGWAWQVPLLELTRTQFLLMSATLGDVSRFEADLTRRTRPAGGGGALRHPPGPPRLPLRPHPAARRRSRTCSARAGAPIYVVHFTQAAAVARAQALTSINVATRAERDASPTPLGRLPLRRRVRPHAGPLPARRDRRPPRRDAAPLPAAGRAPGPGRPAQGHLRDRHPRRRDQRAHPHRACSPAWPSTTGPSPGCSAPGSSTRSPGGPAGPATTRREAWWSRPPSTSSRTSGPWPKPATIPARSAEGGAGQAAPRVSWPGPRRPSNAWSAAPPEPLASSFTVTPLDAAQRPRPPRRRLRGAAPPAHRQRRGPPRPAPPHPPGHRHLPHPGRRRGGRTPGPSRQPGRRVRVTARPAGRLRSQPAAEPVRARRAATARPGCAGVGRSTSSAWSSPPWRTRGRSSPPSSTSSGARWSTQLKSEGVEYEQRMEALDKLEYPKPLGDVPLRRSSTSTGSRTRGRRTTTSSPKSVVRDLYERAMGFSRVRRPLRGNPLGGARRCATSPTPTGA